MSEARTTLGLKRGGSDLNAVTVLEREVYEVGEAARLLGLHVRTLRNWLEGYSAHGKSYPPVLREAATGSDLLTWGEFVEAGYLAEYRRVQKVPLPRIRDYIEDWRARLGVPYPLAHQQPYVGPDHDLMDPAETEGGDTIMYRFRDGQLTMTPWAREFFHKIDFEHQIAQRIWPDGKDQRVVIDPQRAFGAPPWTGCAPRCSTRCSWPATPSPTTTLTAKPSKRPSDSSRPGPSQRSPRRRPDHERRGRYHGPLYAEAAGRVRFGLKADHPQFSA